MLSILLVYSLRKRNIPGAPWFILYCLVVLLFLVFKIVEYHAIDIETKIFWFHIEYPLWLPGTTAMTCFVLEYVRPGRWITHRTAMLLLVVPLAGLSLTLSQDFHGLLFRGYGFNGSIVPLYGPLGQAILFYTFGLQGISVMALAWLFVRSPQHRWPAALIISAELFVGVVHIMDPFLQEAGLFYIPVKAIPVIASAIALFGFHIFDPISLAGTTVIEQLKAGLLVLDLEGRVISLNPAAERILNAPANQVKGRPVEAFFPACSAQFQAGSGEIKIELGIGEKRSFRLRVWPLDDFRGHTVGRLLLMTDVTEQEHAQAQILEQQRSLAMLHERDQLARELHDNLGQVIGFVNTQGQTIHRLLERGDLSTADEYICRLLDVTREADADIRESIAGLRMTLSEQGFHAVLAQYLIYFERNFGIRTALEGSRICSDGFFEPQVEVQLLRILQEALTNVRKHAGAGCVQITFSLEGNCARVAVRDDGQGFEPGVAAAGTREHIGLRVMRERAEEVGGSLSLTSAPGQGTELIVRVPAKLGRSVLEIERIDT